MNRTRIHLLRHGQVEGFEEKRYNGQNDVALTELGKNQYQRIKSALAEKEISAIYSSDLSRCSWGARVVAEPHGLSPVYCSALRELHLGDWEGKTWQVLQQEHPEEWQARLADLVNYQVTGGESLLQMATRVRAEVAAIVARHPGEELVIVGHGGVNRVILLDAIGAPLAQMFHVEQSFGCLNTIDYYPDGIAVVNLLNG